MVLGLEQMMVQVLEQMLVEVLELESGLEQMMVQVLESGPKFGQGLGQGQWLVVCPWMVVVRVVEGCCHHLHVLGIVCLPWVSLSVVLLQLLFDTAHFRVVNIGTKVISWGVSMSTPSTWSADRVSGDMVGAMPRHTATAW